MGRTRKQICATETVLVMALASIGLLLAQEPAGTDLLRWKNGDELPGKLLQSSTGQVRWSSPMFLDNLVVYTTALDSLQFGGAPPPATGAFRVTTLSGDVWTGDLVGSDAETLAFSSTRLGPVRVKRRAIGSIERVAPAKPAPQTAPQEGGGAAAKPDLQTAPTDIVPPAGTPLTRIALRGGTTFLGWLFVGEGGASVVEEDGTRRPVALDEIIRVVQPGAQAVVDPELAELTYADGAVVRGVLVGTGYQPVPSVSPARPLHLVMQTASAGTPVSCVCEAGATLRFGPPEPRGALAGRSSDELFHASGSLHGRLSFVFQKSGLSWVPEGALAPVRLGPIGGVRIVLRRRSLTARSFFDEQEFPYALHLMSGEVLPCRVGSYDENVLRFASPYVDGREIAAAHLKAIEFEPSLGRAREKKSATEPDEWFEAIFGPREKIPQPVEPADLDRALTVPRFYRDQPPTHVLLARNGDVLRGRLVAIHGQTLEFESKRRHETVPIDRLTRVVTITPLAADAGAAAEGGSVPPALVRVTLNDGSVLSFDAIESKHGVLHGLSPVYGDTTIPVENIAELELGSTAAEDSGSVFQQWVSRLAKEPEFNRPAPGSTGDQPVPAGDPPDGMTPTQETTQKVGPESPPAAFQSAGSPTRAAGSPTPPAAEAGSHDAGVPRTLGEQGLALGAVVLDAVTRSLRFPITINQRSGPVEYALVTNTGKTHESIFRTGVDPTHIHVALLLLGGAPSYATQLAADPLEAVPGEPVVISVAWQQGDAEEVHPLEDFITTTDGSGTLTPEPWVYNGSVLQANGLAAQQGGSIVSLQLDPEALINNPRPGRFNDELHRPNSAALPPDDLELRMIIRLVRKPTDPTGARE